MGNTSSNGGFSIAMLVFGGTVNIMEENVKLIPLVPPATMMCAHVHLQGNPTWPKPVQQRPGELHLCLDISQG